ncbi:MAG: GNAT family N-acetyltransferase [Bryobacteraceae bacterium]
MVSVGAPGIANSTTSLRFSLSVYATVLGATLIRSSGILAPSFYNILFRNLHLGIPDARSIHLRALFNAAGQWRGNILNVYTEPAHRRRGMADALMQIALDWCAAN